MNTFQRFWMVLGAGQPIFHHETLGSAEREAERLARLNPVSVFYVLEAVSRCEKSDVAWSKAVEQSETGKIPF